MTALQLAQKFGYSQSYIKKHWKQAQLSLQKKHKVEVVRKGRGQSTDYIIVKNNKRANLLYEEVDGTKALVNHDSLKMINMDFITLVAIIMTPYQVWRGSYRQFLEYIAIPVNGQNIDDLKKSLESLHSKDYIHYAVDKTDPSYFFTGIYRKIEQQMKISIDMMNKCRQIAKDNNRRKWLPLFKLWIAIQYICDNDLQPFTAWQLAELTGMSVNSVYRYIKDLKRECVFDSQKVYVAIDKCIGQKATLNAFYLDTNFIEQKSQDKTAIKQFALK